MRVGPYELLDLIGRGGAGRVHRARAPDGRLVAVKLLHESDPDRGQRFAREQRLLAEEIEGFVPLLDAGTSPAGTYLVMPLIEGGTLGDRIAAGPLPLDEAVDLVTRIARAVGRAHARGIVHRDLKPENVLFDAAGRPLVADLGLAKHVAGTSLSPSLTGELRGTFGYMPPEQLRDAKHVGAQADVFALGAVLYACITGGVPFGGDTLGEHLDRVDAGTYAPIGGPRWLADVVARALAPDPRRRFPDAGALARALERRGARRPLRWIAPVALAVLGGALLANEARARSRRAEAEALRWAAVSTADREAGLAAVERALALAPDDLEARLIRASFLCDLERPEEAAAEARAALARDPDSVEAHAILAQALAAAGATDAAAVEAQAALDRDVRNARAWHVQGTLALARKDRSRALACVDRALELTPGNGYFAMLGARVRLDLGDVAGAVAAYGSAIAIAGYEGQGHAGRALARIKLRDLDGALADSARAVAIVPSMAGVWRAHATVLRARGDLVEARAALDRAVELAPRDPGALMERASLRHRSDAAGIASDCGRILAARPDHPWALHVRAQARRALGDREGALEDLRHAVRVAPSSAVQRANLAALLRDIARTEEALAEADRAVELDPREAHNFWVRASIRALRGDHAAAIEDASRVLALQPAHHDALVLRGSLRAARLDFGRAEADLTEAIRLQPRSESAHLHRGRARDAHGDVEGAVADFRRYLELAPRGPDAAAVRARVRTLAR